MGGNQYVTAITELQDEDPGVLLFQRACSLVEARGRPIREYHQMARIQSERNREVHYGTRLCTTL